MLKSQNKNQDLHQCTISRAVGFLVRIILCCLLILTSGCSPTLLNSQSNNNSRLVLVSPSPPSTFNYAMSRSSYDFFRFIYKGLISENGLTGELEPTNEGYALAKICSTQLCKYLSLEDNIYKVSNGYVANCASCHGLKGKGDGFNAPYLPVAPGNLSDAKTISTRSDDTLYETLYNGGKIMKKHHFMPAWGLKLSHQEIVEHVNAIRKLCDCLPPQWSKK